MLSDIDPFPSLLIEDGNYNDGMRMKVPNFSVNSYDANDHMDIREIFNRYY